MNSPRKELLGLRNILLPIPHRMCQQRFWPLVGAIERPLNQSTLSWLTVLRRFQ